MEEAESLALSFRPRLNSDRHLMWAGWSVLGDIITLLQHPISLRRINIYTLLPQLLESDAARYKELAQRHRQRRRRKRNLEIKTPVNF